MHDTSGYSLSSSPAVDGSVRHDDPLGSPLATSAEVVAALSSIVLDGGTCVPQLELGGAQEEFVELAQTLLTIRSASASLARGRIGEPFQPTGPIAGALSALQANLAQIMQQAQRIAAGDLTQRLDPVDDFALGFNAMADRLMEKRDAMHERETQLQLAALATEHAALTMTIFDKTGRYLYANRLMSELTGYSPEELVEMHVWDTAPEFTLEKLTAAWGVFAPLGEMHVETTTRRKDGTTYPIHVAIAVMHVDGEELGVAFGSDISERRAAEEHTAAMVVQLETLMQQTVNTIALIVETRDPYTAGHQRRVSELAVAIGHRMSIDERTVAGLRVAGLLHDVGKTAVPSEILSKPGTLSEVEFEIAKEHAHAGHEILAGIEFPWPVAEIVWQHHERLDGSGYPRGLSDGEIMTEARILAVADVVEAMSAHRPYRASLGVDAALAEIQRGRASIYDADVVDACLSVFREGGFSFI